MNKAKINHFYLILVVLIIGFNSNNVNAQDFRLGFKGNPMFSSLKPGSDFNSSVGTKIGFSYGIMFDYFLKEHYVIETELGISSLGGNVEYAKADTTISSNISMNYVEVPIAIKLLTDEINGKIKVFGKFGLNIGFATKTSAKVQYKFKDVEYNYDDIKNASNYIQSFNTSLIIGGGIEYKLAKNLDLVLGITYSNGLMNTMKSPSLYRKDATNQNIKAFDADLNYFALNIGLLF